MTDQADDTAVYAAMRRALALAADPGFTSGPNPRVGCVLLSASGQVIGEGWHRAAGEPHAEIEALRVASDAALGATAVVTLEPCNHTGRTGPCTEALITAGVRRVVHAATDPNPVAGGGAARLTAAGIDVVSGPLALAAEALNPAWTAAMRTGRPYVRWKMAASLDGRSAAADGSSRWISSATARADVHRLRASVQAIMVGTGTALADQPRLTARDHDHQPLPRDRQPLRVVVGRRALPSSAALLDDSAETMIITSHDPSVILARLFERGVYDVLLEGGPTLATAFLRADLIDEVIAYLAPVLLGAGASAVGDFGITSIDQAQRLDLTDITIIGTGPDRNLRLTAHPVRTAPGSSTTTHPVTSLLPKDN